MKTMNKIIAILGIALLAIATVGAVSAEPVERTVLGNAWNYDVVGDDFDYFIYDGTEDAASGSVSEVIGAWNYTPAPVPVIPDYEVRAGFNVDDWNGYTAGEWPFNPGEFDPIHSEPNSVWLVGEFNPGHPEPTRVL